MSKYKPQQIIAAIRLSECCEIDYGDMEEDEKRALDNALDKVFWAAKEYTKIMGKYTELKVLEAKDL